MEQMTTTDTDLVAELNDLLQLDHDAVAAYTLAIRELSNEGYKETVRRFRMDHERHIQDLTHLIHIFHGEPVQAPHLLSGPFKLAIQAVGAVGGDIGVLIAFKANERVSRDRYAKAAAQSFPLEVSMVLRRGAEDESRHYAWATSVLERLGVDESNPAGSMRRGLQSKKGVATLVGSALAVIGAGAVAAYLIKKR